MPWESNHRLWNNPEALYYGDSDTFTISREKQASYYHDQKVSQFPPPHPKEFAPFCSNKHARAFTGSSIQVQLKDPAVAMLAEWKHSSGPCLLTAQTACQLEWKRKLKIKICLHFPKGKPLIKKRLRVIPKSPFCSTPCDAQANRWIPTIGSVLMKNKKRFTILPKVERKISSVQACLLFLFVYL